MLALNEDADNELNWIRAATCLTTNKQVATNQKPAP